MFYTHRLTLFASVNCRLPQTPRTPGAGLSHYFDDVLHRTAHLPGAQTPMLSPNAPRLRRSSTSRSLAARSDFSVNGYESGTGGDETPAAAANDNGNGIRRGSVNPALVNDPERVKARAEREAHLHSYITQQLERVRLERGGGEAGVDEIEASP
jgi:hypothetical protein